MINHQVFTEERSERLAAMYNAEDKEPDDQDGFFNDTRWKRRRFVAGTSAFLAGGLAGCTGDGGSGQDNPTENQGGDDSQEPTTSGGTSQPEDASEGPAFGDAIDLRDEYAFEITAHYQNLEWSGRQQGDNHYNDIRLSGGQRVETYFVDGASYVVTQGLCMTNPDTTTDPTSNLDLQLTNPETFEGAVSGHATVKPTGTTTLDGEKVHVFEISASGTRSVYYVSAETGLLRRFEEQTPQGEIVIEFHSWGDVDPIEAPNCPGAAIEGPVFGDAIELEDEYAFEITAHYQDMTVSGRQHGDDHYHDIQLAGTNVEEYVVDGTSYVVTQGVCVTDPNASQDPTSDLDLAVTDSETHEGAVTGNATVKPIRTTTINGKKVYVYEISANGTRSIYYVSAETSQLRQFEMNAPEGEIVIEFHSWGNVDPIESPSNCL